ncbi:MAG TPA: hypothetical protein DEB31_01045 [Clostridiales bacterium]|nr:hypothetical protein [Clostridiales bacterium]
MNYIIAVCFRQLIWLKRKQKCEGKKYLQLRNYIIYGFFGLIRCYFRVFPQTLLDLIKLSPTEFNRQCLLFLSAHIRKNRLS